jgi:Protein phosphatase 2C
VSEEGISLVFASEDHNMTEKHKVWDIQQRGGKFLNPFTVTLLDVYTQPPSEREGAYIELSNARIFRPMSPQIAAVGCSHRRTLNLTATMGDLLFKIEPAVLTAKPDVSFVKITGECVLVMATDGVWDHLSAPSAAGQNAQILSLLRREFDADTSLPELEETSSVASVSTQRVLEAVADEMVAREGGEMFVQGLGRYDDAMAAVVYISM